ncbi:hypothetical protein [Bradyrhizobium diazoefficiens]|uniref:hypothetical protein n=1 Tax=Bradyrhizobium diazoefficiens TaxID=1355477 RepID=UPI00272C85C9|nr:hypothetical protein [Bradyrhizobium diazoefficiens]WLA64915.1 hypothetical protein QNN01_42985 [Bradyrhizobium diazoefficiens]
MSGVVGDWRGELIERHRDLFHPPAGVLQGAEGLPECGPGWRDLLDRCCVRIRAAVEADGGTFRFTQIKEKYGTARLYWTGRLSPEASARVEEAIDLAEARSACTCEVCGEAGVLRSGGWLTTRCDQHAEGRAAVEVRPGFENIHIVRYGIGQQRRITCRRYHRENDAFLDVDPASLGIGED